MPTRSITDLLLDTSYLTGVGAPYSSDFQKLVALSKAKTIRVIVPHIAWEERRTQLLEDALEPIQRARNAFEAVAARHSRSPLLSELTPPIQVLWKDVEVYEKSKEVMKALAEESKIEIVAIGADHAARAWERYFSNGEPFNPVLAREDRRKDIPDSWILETAIDLKLAYPNLRAVCGDKRLSDALESVGVPVFRITKDKRAAQVTQEILDAIQAELTSVPEDLPKAAELTAEHKVTGTDEIRRALVRAQSAFTALDEKALGFVAYLGEVAKDQLIELLTRNGNSAEMARNAAERLSLTGLLVDTGNHYLVADKAAGEQAASLVESEIAELLKRSR